MKVVLSGFTKAHYFFLCSSFDYYIAKTSANSIAKIVFLTVSKNM